MKDVREALFVGTTTDGRTVRRPLSPHLQIYKPQITSALSIFHRITGVALSVGTLVLVWWLVAAATSEASFATVSMVLHTWIGHLALIGVTFHHMALGLQVVLEDYIHSEKTRLGAIMAMKAVTYLLAIAAILSVLKLAVIG
jgi:succinate dehydrogenase / fumarate reductase cytochrome b subunit